MVQRLRMLTVQDWNSVPTSGASGVCETPDPRDPMPNALSQPLRALSWHPVCLRQVSLSFEATHTTGELA